MSWATGPPPIFYPSRSRPLSCGSSPSTTRPQSPWVIAWPALDERCCGLNSSPGDASRWCHTKVLDSALGDTDTVPGYASRRNDCWTPAPSSWWTCCGCGMLWWPMNAGEQKGWKAEALFSWGLVLTVQTAFTIFLPALVLPVFVCLVAWMQAIVAVLFFCGLVGWSHQRHNLTQWGLRWWKEALQWKALIGQRGCHCHHWNYYRIRPKTGGGRHLHEGFQHHQAARLLLVDL